MSPREFYREAEAAWRVAQAYSVRLIINDRVDVALALAAVDVDNSNALPDVRVNHIGVHLGQDDLPPEDARRVLGANAIIGFSTHNLEQAIAAARLSVNYIAVGPIFATSSKENPDPVVGLDGLQQVRARLGHAIPLVAIGGIKKHDAREVLAAGANAVAVLGALYAEDANIAQRVAEFLQQTTH